jgi:hypothetical protein
MLCPTNCLLAHAGVSGPLSKGIDSMSFAPVILCSNRTTRSATFSAGRSCHIPRFLSTCSVSVITNPRARIRFALLAQSPIFTMVLCTNLPLFSSATISSDSTYIHVVRAKSSYAVLVLVQVGSLQDFVQLSQSRLPP